QKICIVLTSINTGEVLDGYCRQADDEGVRERLRIIVIPDRKTPRQLHQRCKDFAALGFDLVCPTLEEQEAFLQKVGPIGPLIPYNSDNRRNVGFLMALEWDCDVLLSIDDDNYCLNAKDTFAAYSIIGGGEVSLPAI